MIRSLVNRLAVRDYKKDVNSFIEVLDTIDEAGKAEILVTSVWTRAGLQIEGHFERPGGTKINEPYLYTYPIILEVFEDAISALFEKGASIDAFGLSIWTLSLKCLINHSLMNVELDNLWRTLMASEDHWSKYLDKRYKEDLSSMDPAMVEEIMSLSRNILDHLPPRPSSEYSS